MESQLCRGEEVVVIGGGNSAGQAAVFLAQTAARVHILVRGDGLADTMSRYLIRRIEQNPAIELHTHTELCALEGSNHLERVDLARPEYGRKDGCARSGTYSSWPARIPPRTGSTAASRSMRRDS